MRLPECPGAPLDPQAKWVRRPDRIVTDVGVGIDASPQPDRIALDVASYRGVEVSEVVLEQSRLCIEVLAGAAQVVAHSDGTLWVLNRRPVAEGIGVRAPESAVGVAVGDGPGRVPVTVV